MFFIDYEIYLYDRAGHGFSSHIPKGFEYSAAHNLQDLRTILQSSSLFSSFINFYLIYFIQLLSGLKKKLLLLVIAMEQYLEHLLVS